MKDYKSIMRPLFAYMDGKSSVYATAQEIDKAYQSIADDIDSSARSQMSMASGHRDIAMMLFAALRSPEQKELYSFAVDYIAAMRKDLPEPNVFID